MTQKQDADQQYWAMINLTLIAGFIMGLLYAMTYKMHFDIEQMLTRGVEFAKNNNLIFYGNAASAGMGKVPGGLSSLLVGLPLKVYFSPYSVLALLIGTHYLAFHLLLKVFKEYFAPFSLLLFTLLYWLSPWHLSEFYIWNPSYLFLPMALHLWSSFEMNKRKNFLATFIHVLSLWYAFQIHNSSIILLFISAILWQRKKIVIHWPAALLSAGIGIGTLVPYAMELINDPNLSPEIRDDRFFMFRGLLYVFPILKGVLYWLRFSSGVFPKHMMQHLDLGWISNGQLQWVAVILVTGIKYIIAAVTAVLSIRINWQYFKKRKSQLLFKNWQSKELSWLDYYCLAGFLGLVIAAAMSPIDLIYWHLIILFPVTLIPVLYAFEAFKNTKVKQRVTIGLLVYFSFYNILAAMGSEKHTIFTNPQKEFVKMYGKN